MINPHAPTPTGAEPVARPASARSEGQVVRDLMPFLKPYWGRITLALAMVLIGKFANLIVPMVLKHLVDDLGLKNAPLALVLPAGLLIAYGASRLTVTLFTELRQVVFARVMARVSRRR